MHDPYVDKRLLAIRGRYLVVEHAHCHSFHASHGRSISSITRYCTGHTGHDAFFFKRKHSQQEAPARVVHLLGLQGNVKLLLNHGPYIVCNSANRNNTAPPLCERKLLSHEPPPVTGTRNLDAVLCQCVPVCWQGCGRAWTRFPSKSSLARMPTKGSPKGDITSQRGHSVMRPSGVF